jgi:hypothetical protein
MHAHARFGLLLTGALVAACSSTVSNRSDSGAPTSTHPDSGILDAGPLDAGLLDAGPLDAGSLDAGSLDAGPLDAGLLDAGLLDAGLLDAGWIDPGAGDAGTPDAGLLDAGLPDAGWIDPGTSDAGPPDAGWIDPGTSDAGPPDAGWIDPGTGDAGSTTTVCTGGHVQFASAYWAGTAAYGDHLAELAPAISVGHVDLPRLSSPLPPGVDVIVDLHWNLFDFTTHTVRADLAAQLDSIAAAVNPVASRVRALYLIDEPYVADHLIPRSQLEQAITTVKNRFPSIPTYITFAHHCFDPSSTDVACQVPATERGIPAGLDWVGFDWYNDSNDLSVAGTHVATNIASGVDRIGQLAPSAKVIIVPEAYTDGNRLESTAVAVLHDYFELAAQNPAVSGVDFFLMADAPGMLGMVSLPSVRASVRGFSRWVQKECGQAPALIPITEWYSASGPDFRYEPWVWTNRASGYRVDATAFALPPENTAGTVPLWHCLIDRGTSVDSFLTVDAACEGAPLVQPAVTVGGIFSTPAPGTVELHRFAQQGPPFDRAYALSPTAALPAGYVHEFAVGWVYPPSAL